MRLPILLAVTVSLAAAMPAIAQSTTDDVRCLIASNVFATAEKDPQKKQLSVVSRYFYLGRVDARMSADQLKAQVIAQGKLLNAQNVGTVMTECAHRVGAKDQQLQELGKQIAANAQAQKTSETPK